VTGARSKRRTRCALAGVLALALLAGGLSARDENWRPAAPRVETQSFPYSGGFTFARIRFEPTIWGGGPFMWGLDLKWNHDYPFAEENFTRIVDEITDIEVQTEGGNVLELTDPRLFEHPWAYLCEPGFWNPTEEELENLRSYLFKGGFLVFDDFFDVRGYPVQWENFERQMGRLLPGYELVPLTVDHPVFRSFFVLEDINFDIEDVRFYPVRGRIYGVFEDNDPSRRLMAVINYNMDIGDFWEWSETTFYPVDVTQKGFKLGVNYLIYGMTH